MSKAFMLLQDLHLAVQKENRFHYDEECFSVLARLGAISKYYREERNFTEVNGISLGDLVDGSNKVRSRYVAVQQQIKVLLSYFDKFYLNFGNHEITYYKDNPVYSFIADIQHPDILFKFPQLHCESIFNEILTPEYLEFANLEIVFRGWETNTKPHTDKKSIMLLHEALLDECGISDVYQATSYLPEVYTLSNDSVEEVYCGHVHTVISDWELMGIKVHNLGSLLRTSILEISDYSRERPIVVLLFDNNNNYIGKECQTIILHERQLIVDENSVVKSQIQREDYKEQLKIRNLNTMPLLDIQNPIEAARQTLEGYQDEELLKLFDQLKCGEVPIWR